MKKYIVGGTGKNKLYEVAYFKADGEIGIQGTCYAKVIAKDVIEAAEIILNMEKINAADIEYINECKDERIIG